MDAIRSLTTTTFIAAVTMMLLPSKSEAQGQLDSKKITITKFKKNVQKLDQLAKKMVIEAKDEPKIYRGATSEMQALSKHSKLTGDLVKATLIGHPGVVRQASLDVENNLKQLKLLRSKSKNPEKIDKLIRISTVPANYVAKNFDKFNKANQVEKTKPNTPSKKTKPGEIIPNLLKKAFKKK